MTRQEKTAAETTVQLQHTIEQLKQLLKDVRLSFSTHVIYLQEQSIGEHAHKKETQKL